MTERPLISLVLVGYNQERFIRAAIEGALSQTYSPLEILFTDDCSADQTFALMQEAAKDYHGPHTVRLNRNEHNLGISGNVNKAMKLTHGELVVIAAGDDVSLPHRVEKTWQAYRDSRGAAMSLYGNARVINEQGKQLGLLRKLPHPGLNDFSERIDHPMCVVSGCTHAWSRKVFDVFGDLNEDVPYEDMAIAFRSTMLGSIRHVDEIVALYRVHSENASDYQRVKDMDAAGLLAFAARKRRIELSVLKNNLKDVKVVHDALCVPAQLRQKMQASLEKQIRLVELEIAFIEGTMGQRLRVVLKGLVRGVRPGKLARWSVRLVLPFLYIRRLRGVAEWRSRFAERVRTCDQQIG